MTYSQRKIYHSNGKYLFSKKRLNEIKDSMEESEQNRKFELKIRERLERVGEKKLSLEKRL